LGTAFTYQGQLKSGGSGVTGACEMAFRLFDAATVGNPVGVPLTQTVAVNEGLFTSQLDFGAGAFQGDARWLEIAVKCPGDATFTPLSRQALTAAPYALFASNTDLLDGQHASTFVTLSGTQKISGVKTFSGGLKFADGTTQTTAFYRPALPGPGAAATVDSAGDIGRWASITIGADGLGLISYLALTNSDLKVFRCSNVTCTPYTRVGR
jgi:hypothetical protein